MHVAVGDRQDEWPMSSLIVNTGITYAPFRPSFTSTGPTPARRRAELYRFRSFERS
jgi:hypothetical protein